MWRECGWCKEKGIVTIMGCYDNNGSRYDCKGCEYQNCPSPIDLASTGICDNCLEEHRQKQYQDKILDEYDGSGIS